MAITDGEWIRQQVGSGWDGNCDWCSKRVMDEDRAWYWIGAGFELRMHDCCFVDWQQRLHLDMYVATTGKTVTLRRVSVRT